MISDGQKKPRTRASRVAVVGAGALGSWLAAQLVAGAHDVALVTRPSTASGVIRCQIATKDALSSTATDVPAAPASLMPGEAFDVLLFCTKAGDLESAVEQTLPLLRKDGVVAVLSNGLGHEQSLKNLGVQNCVAATVTYGLFKAPDGVVHLRGDGGEIAVGPMLKVERGATEHDEGSQRLADLLEGCGLNARVVADGKRLVWKKAMLNAGLNPVAALVGCQNGDLPGQSVFALSVEAAKEAQRAAASLGIDLSDVDPEKSLRDLCRDTFSNRCSTLQDLEARRATEMDWICGAVRQVLESDGQESPANTLLSALIHRAEMAYETCGETGRISAS